MSKKLLNCKEVRSPAKAKSAWAQRLQSRFLTLHFPVRLTESRNFPSLFLSLLERDFVCVGAVLTIFIRLLCAHCAPYCAHCAPYCALLCALRTLLCALRTLLCATVRIAHPTVRIAHPTNKFSSHQKFGKIHSTAAAKFAAIKSGLVWC